MRTLLGLVFEGALDALGECDEGDARESKRTEPVVLERGLLRRRYTGQLAPWRGNRVIGSAASWEGALKLRRSLTARG